MSQTTEWATHMTRDHGHACLLQVQSVLARALTEAEYLLEQYQQADTDAARAQVLNRCIEFMPPFIANNLRLDLLAQRQAELLVLARTGRSA
jgi:hypothetical protein